MLALRTTAVGSVSCAKSPASYHNVLALGNNLDGSRLKLLMGHGRLMLTFLLQVFFSQPKSHESTPSKTPVTSRPADFSQHDFHSVKWKNNCVRSSLVFMVRTPHVTATMRPSPPTSKGATCAPARGGGRNADTRDEGGGGRTGVLIAGHVSSHKVIPWLQCRDGARLRFHRTCSKCLHQVRSAVRCSASCMKGVLHPLRKLGQGGWGDSDGLLRHCRAGRARGKRERRAHAWYA